ncbi:MAG TPA: HNH endonuclease [Clostridium sp.]|nr:HNH endonuclease [Clostridium sp.]
MRKLERLITRKDLEICNKLFVEVHHIIPKLEGGSDSIDNAAPLCSSCHDLFGGNPEKRKQIRQMRDYWWEQMDEWRLNLVTESDPNFITIIEENPENINQLKDKGIAIYHIVYENEDFEKSAQILFNLIKQSQKTSPNQKRILYLDIEGHRNKKGGFDNDMYELQRHFILEFLMPYLNSVYIPLSSVKNKKLQRNDIPDELHISSVD